MAQSDTRTQDVATAEGNVVRRIDANHAVALLTEIVRVEGDARTQVAGAEGVAKVAVVIQEGGLGVTVEAVPLIAVKEGDGVATGTKAVITPETSKCWIERELVVHPLGVLWVLLGLQAIEGKHSECQNHDFLHPSFP